ncbi:MAG: hypothetical protein RL365_701 [Bacteroidota bacterium]|jgi:uncharacterized protein (TIGR02145 family)
MKKFNLIVLISLLLSSCNTQDNKPKSKEVKIGNQIWMTENLNVETFRNGDIVPEAKSAKDWLYAAKNKKPAWCYYENDLSNGKCYGKLYNWYALTDSRGLAPKGWHIPTYAEWSTLIDFLGGWENALSKMKSPSGWDNEGNGSNKSGFFALPGGFRYDDGSFSDIGFMGYWWSATDTNTRLPETAYTINLDSFEGGGVTDYNLYKNNGLSIRCIKN